MRKPDIHKSAGIIVQNRKLLTTRAVGSDIYIPPGGSIEKGETQEIALIRELEEELTIKVLKENLSFFGSFTAKAAGQEDKVVCIDFYIVKAWEGELKPSMEVEEIKWINSESVKHLKIGSIFAHDIVPRLKEQDIID